MCVDRCAPGILARLLEGRAEDVTDSLGDIVERSKAWFFGKEGFRGRTKACIECLGEGLCKCRTSDFRESFCITDALLRAAILGDTTRGLFYTGQSVTRIPERTVEELRSVQELITGLEEIVAPSAR